MRLNYILLVALSALPPCYSYQAVVVTRVADLVGEPFVPPPTTKNSAHSVKKAYQKLTVTNRPNKSCLRIHQLLFNELVDIIDERDHQVCLTFRGVLCQTPATTEPQTTFWSLKSNFVRTDTLPEDIRAAIPPPIDFSNPLSTNREHIIGLAKPWYDATSKHTFSVGTRFVAKKRTSKKSTTKQCTVTIVNPIKKLSYHVNIPTAVCMKDSQRNKRHAFINILKQWAHESTPIPYVLGGCSYVPSPHPHLITPFCGFDCSGLIVRAAQLCGLPYFFKNTYTIEHNAQAICPDQAKNGDLLWLPGHVMIISDLKNNLLIEARGYDHGYGKVHEIAVHNVFENIANYDDLMKAIQTHTPLRRLNSAGKPIGNHTLVKIFKLPIN